MSAALDLSKVPAGRAETRPATPRGEGDRPEKIASAPLAAVPVQREQRTRRAVAALVTGAALLTAAGLFHVWVRLRVLEYQIGLGIELERQSQLVEANRRLRTEDAWLLRPGAIEAAARDRLGMVPPDPALVRTLPVQPSVLSATSPAAISWTGER